MLAAVAGELAPGAWEDASARSAGAAVFLLAFDSLAGFLLYTSLLRDTPIGLVGTYAYVVPLIAVALGVRALGDHVSVGAALGAAVAMAAVTAQLRAAPLRRARELHLGLLLRRGRVHLALRVGERAHVGLRRRLDDVGRDALAGGGLAGELEHDARLAERVLAARHRVDAELAQARLALRGGVDRTEDRVDRAVAGEVAERLLPVRGADRDARVRRAAVGDVDVEPLRACRSAARRGARR